MIKLGDMADMPWRGRVVYVPDGGVAEAGTIQSINRQFAFVRYDDGAVKATEPDRLFWLQSDDDEYGSGYRAGYEIGWDRGRTRGEQDAYRDAAMDLRDMEAERDQAAAELERNQG